MLPRHPRRVQPDRGKFDPQPRPAVVGWVAVSKQRSSSMNTFRFERHGEIPKTPLSFRKLFRYLRGAGYTLRPHHQKRGVFLAFNTKRVPCLVFRKVNAGVLFRTCLPILDAATRKRVAFHEFLSHYNSKALATRAFAEDRWSMSISAWLPNESCSRETFSLFIRQLHQDFARLCSDPDFAYASKFLWFGGRCVKRGKRKLRQHS